jgi:2,3-dihydroxybenzoate-AMP ligase
VIVGVPDEALGERTCACVIARGTAPTRAELVSHLTDLGVAAFKLPDRLEVFDTLPRTAVGKIDKKALAALVSGAPR